MIIPPTIIAYALRALPYVLGAAVLLGLYTWRVGVERDYGRDEVRAEWAVERQKQTSLAVIEAAANAEETKRRLEIQKENQDAQDRELAVARAAADRNAADADSVRKRAAASARDWSARLADSPTREDLAAAAAAIAVLTDVRGRLDSAAGELASYASAARAAGLKCERDYDALTSPN